MNTSHSNVALHVVEIDDDTAEYILLQETLTKTAALRAYAEKIAKRAVDEKDAQDGSLGRRRSNLSRDVARTFDRDGTLDMLSALYSTAFKNRRGWCEFPEELSDLRHFISDPFGTHIDSGIRTARGDMLARKKIVASSAAVKIFRGEPAFQSYRAWSAATGIDQRVLKYEWNTKRSSLRTLVSGEIRRLRRKAHRTLLLAKSRAKRKDRASLIPRGGLA